MTFVGVNLNDGSDDPSSGEQGIWIGSGTCLVVGVSDVVVPPVPEFSNRRLGMVGDNRSNESEGITLRFEKSVYQTIGGISKITGMVRAKYLIPLIDALDLQANPRLSKTGQVTKAIQESITEDSELFPFKTKGILLAASNYQNLDRGRVRVFFDNRNLEGILDGGHNTLAIGQLILRRALELSGESLPKGQMTWDQFKSLWKSCSGAISKYQESVRRDDDVAADDSSVRPDLSFYVPVELLVPSDPDDKMCIDNFRNNLLEICEARNNNVELTEGAKASQKGYFDDLRRVMMEVDPHVASRIEWKTNDGGEIKIQDIAALAWIVLAALPEVRDSDGKIVSPPSPQNLYSGKGGCLKKFDQFMSSADVTSQLSTDYKADLRNPMVMRAFRLVAQIPALYDYIYEQFPDLYNHAGGSYGNINAVRKLNEGRVKLSPFSATPVSMLSPDGFIVPLVSGLTVLVDPDTMTWKADPKSFLERNLGKIVERFAQILPPCDYDPQKVGKAKMSYSRVADAYTMALVGII